MVTFCNFVCDLVILKGSLGWLIDLGFTNISGVGRDLGITSKKCVTPIHMQMKTKYIMVDEMFGLVSSWGLFISLDIKNSVQEWWL